MASSDLAKLDFLVAIAECGSLTAAAEKLNLSQPALSYRLARVERELNTSVFTREGRKLHLTPAGRRVLAAARTIEDEISSLKTDVARIGGVEQSVLRISTQCYTTYQWLPEIIKNLRSEFPGLDVEIVVAATQKPLAALNKGKIDLALTTEEPKNAGLASAIVLKDEIFAVLPETHSLADRVYVTPRQIANEKLILYSADASPLIDDFLTPAKVTPAHISSVPLTEGILELVRAGIGVGSLAGWVLDKQHMRGLIRVRLGKRGLYREWRVLYKKEPENYLLTKFIAELKRSINGAV